MPIHGIELNKNRIFMKHEWNLISLNPKEKSITEGQLY